MPPPDGPPPGNPDGHCAIPAEAGLEDISNPTAVVGTGTPESCTGDAFVQAVAGGGVITFNCGPAPVTITLARTAKIFNDKGPKIVIDGGGKVTLSGGGRVRILYQNTCDQAQKWTTSHCQNQDTPQLTVQNLTFVDGNSKGETLEGGGGGAIFVRGGRLKIVNSRFFRNVCDDVGPDVGGAAVRTLEPVQRPAGLRRRQHVRRREDLGNVCSNGGGLSSIGVSYSVINSLFSHNNAIGNGANPAKAGTPGGGSGGAIYNDGNTFTLSLCGVEDHEQQRQRRGRRDLLRQQRSHRQPRHSRLVLEQKPEQRLRDGGISGDLRAGQRSARGDELDHREVASDAGEELVTLGAISARARGSRWLARGAAGSLAKAYGQSRRAQGRRVESSGPDREAWKVGPGSTSLAGAMMKICPRCGGTFAGGSFCPGCGVRQPLIDMSSEEAKPYLAGSDMQRAVLSHYAERSGMVRTALGFLIGVLGRPFHSAVRSGRRGRRGPPLLGRRSPPRGGFSSRAARCFWRGAWLAGATRGCRATSASTRTAGREVPTPAAARARMVDLVEASKRLRRPRPCRSCRNPPEAATMLFTFRC